MADTITERPNGLYQSLTSQIACCFLFYSGAVNVNLILSSQAPSNNAQTI